MSVQRFGRLSDERVAYFADPERYSGQGGNSLAQEVRAGRELVANLRAVHSPEGDLLVTGKPWCWLCDTEAPCRVVRMIEEAGL